MTSPMIDISKPTAIAEFYEMCTFIENSISITLSWSFNTEIGISIMKAIT